MGGENSGAEIIVANDQISVVWVVIYFFLRLPAPHYLTLCCQLHIHSPVVAVAVPVSFGQKPSGSFGALSGA